MKQKSLEFIKNHYTIIAVIFFSLVYISFFNTAYKAIKTGSRPLTERVKVKPKVEEEKEAEVILRIDINGNEKALSAKLKTQDSLADLFEYLRLKNLIKFESIAYNDGAFITKIDNTVNNQNFKWILYQLIDMEPVKEIEIKDYTKTKLQNHGVYLLRFTRI
ncbi:hypothetical protein HYV31_02165 [candidate division WWE3 bacterium]|nr:hypothetical protein [candidate division WWE3 bacterium]